MRWIFADQSNPEEMKYRQARMQAIDIWWRAFQSKASQINNYFSQGAEFDVVTFMRDYLGNVDPRLMWEYGPAKKGEGHRLVITPESNHWLRPVLRTLLERAPKIPGWEFYPHRLPEDVEQTIRTVEGRVGANITGALVAASVAPGRKIDLWFAFPQQPHFDEDTANSAAFVATETLMGEYVMDTWIGSIGLLDGSLRPLPMARAQATVSSVIRSIQEQLPPARSQDIGEEARNWSSLKLEAAGPADDYATRDDLLFASTTDVERFRAAHNGRLFASACHSRFGELFCYLKLDGEAVPRDRFVEFRGQFEDALNPALVQAGVGCCIGGGSGIRYAYIDLALTDVNRAVPIIRQVLAAGRAPLRTWLLFCDSELEREWVGLYAQTPPPLMPAEAES